MLQVVVYINGHPILVKTAGRLEPFQGVDHAHTYRDDEGKLLTHVYSKGAAALAIKLLQRHVRAQKRRRID